MTYDQVLQFLANATFYCTAESYRASGDKLRQFATMDAAVILTARYCDIELERRELLEVR